MYVQFVFVLRVHVLFFSATTVGRKCYSSICANVLAIMSRLLV